MRHSRTVRGRRVAEQVATQDSRIDQLTPVVVRAILITVVLVLFVLLYGLVAGVLNPPAPRTYEEYMMVRAKAMVEATPASGQYWADYIDVTVRKEDYSRAANIIEEAREAVGDDPTILLVNNAELRMLLAQERNEEVLERSEAFLKQDAEFRAEEYKRFMEKGVNVPDSFNRTRVAVTIDTLGLQALAAVALEQYDVALEALTAALELDPLAADVAIFRGNVCVLKGDPESLERARKDFTYALRFMPDSEAALDGLSEVEELTGVDTTTTP